MTSIKKWTCIIGGLLFFIPINGTAQSSDVELIKQNFDRQLKCWNKGDIDCYVEAYVRSD